MESIQFELDEGVAIFASMMRYTLKYAKCSFSFVVHKYVHRQTERSTWTLIVIVVRDPIRIFISFSKLLSKGFLLTYKMKYANSEPFAEEMNQGFSRFLFHLFFIRTHYKRDILFLYF